MRSISLLRMTSASDATITDNVAVLRADVVVTDPLGAVLGNFSMVPVGASDVFSFERPYATLGNYTIVAWAVDTSGNNASATASRRELSDVRPFDREARRSQLNPEATEGQA